MKLFSSSVLVFSFVAITIQDIGERKGYDCSLNKGVENKLNSAVGKKIRDYAGGKYSCNICEKRKKMLQLEREKKEKLKKCPFDILGSPTAIKGISSEEIFDEFRQQIFPGQNGFFDGLMRGIVKTMHVSSVAELKWAKEKEARELAKKKKEEEAKRTTALETQKKEVVNLNNPVPPKVTVVLKQASCGQILGQNENAQSERIDLIKRLPKEAARISEDETDLQSLDYTFDYQTEKYYSDLYSKDNLHHPGLIDQLIAYNMRSTVEPHNKETRNTETSKENYFSILKEENNLLESLTESPYVKFDTRGELTAFSAEKIP